MSPMQPTVDERGVRGGAIATTVWVVFLSAMAVAGLSTSALAAGSRGAPADAPGEVCMPLVQVPPTEWNLPVQSDAERAARRAEVEARRSRPFVILHRGASYVAPENTLAAFNGALDLGADGWEMDVRRTRDGALIVFHDFMLRYGLVDGIGLVERMYYEELLLYPFAAERGGRPYRFRAPTLAETFALARERRALLFLEIKGRGMDEEVARMLTAADLWDHVVYVHHRNSDALRSDPRYREADWRADLTFANRKAEGAQDAELAVVRRALESEGQHIIAGDPRVALEALGRAVGTFSQPLVTAPTAADPPDITRLIGALFGLDPFLDGRLAAAQLVNYYGDTAAANIAAQMGPGLPCSARVSVAWALGMIARHYPEAIDETSHQVLLGLAADPDPVVRAEAARALGFCGLTEDVPLLVGLASEGYSRERTFATDVGIEAGRVALTQVRAAAAESLGRLGDTRPSVIEALEALVLAPAAHYPFNLASSYDGFVAARSLARLDARGSLPVLLQLLESDGGDLKAANPQVTGRGAAMLAWHDIQAQGEAARAIALMGSADDLRPLISRLNATDAEDAGRGSVLLVAAVPSLAARRATDARRACSEALFSPMGIVRREAFFRLLAADDPALTAQAVASALSARLADTEDPTGCAMALHLLGLLGQRSPQVAATVAAGEAASDEAVRERAVWCQKTLYGSG